LSPRLATAVWVTWGGCPPPGRSLTMRYITMMMKGENHCSDHKDIWSLGSRHLDWAAPSNIGGGGPIPGVGGAVESPSDIVRKRLGGNEKDGLSKRKCKKTGEKKPSRVLIA